MATPRDYLDSIIGAAAKLQNKSDDELNKVLPELKEVDNILDNTLDALEGN